MDETPPKSERRQRNTLQAANTTRTTKKKTVQNSLTSTACGPDILSRSSTGLPVSGPGKVAATPGADDAKPPADGGDSKLAADDSSRCFGVQAGTAPATGRPRSVSETNGPAAETEHKCIIRRCRQTSQQILTRRSMSSSV